MSRKILISHDKRNLVYVLREETQSMHSVFHLIFKTFSVVASTVVVDYASIVLKKKKNKQTVALPLLRFDIFWRVFSLQTEGLKASLLIVKPLKADL